MAKLDKALQLTDKEKQKMKEQVLEDARKLQAVLQQWRSVKAPTRYMRCLRSGPLHRVDDKNDRIESFFAALYGNWLLIYNAQKEPSPNDVPKRFFKLEHVDPMTVKRIDGGHFQFVYLDEVYRFTAESHEDSQNWYFELSRHIPRLVEAYKDVHGQSIEDCTAIFPSPNFAIPPPILTSKDGILNWLDTYRYYISEQKRWQSYLSKIRAFPELASLNANYLDYFFGEANSNTTSILSKVEAGGQNAVKLWKKSILKTFEDARSAYEQCYFEDDLQDIVKRVSLALVMLDAIYLFYHDVVNQPDPDESNSLDMAVLLNAYIDFFHALPKATSITVEGSSEGLIITNGQQWKYNLNAANAKEGQLLCRTLKSMPSFTVRGFECPSVNSGLYGNVIWNKMSWVWFHQRLRWAIRYNWIAAEKTFKFHPGNPEQWQPGQMILPNWKWTGSALVPDESSDAYRTIPIDLHKCEVYGGVPLQAVLLIAMMPHLLGIMQEVLGIVLPDAGKVMVYRRRKN